MIPLTRPRVLFVEDNVTQLDLYAMALDPDLEILRATRASAGYAMAVQEAPEAIILDVILPDQDGLAMYQQLRTHPSTATTPVIILTGDDAAHARARLIEGEFAAVLTKPCSANRLLAAVHAAIKGATA